MRVPADTAIGRDNGRPGLTVIGRFVNVWFHVTKRMAVKSCVSRRGFVEPCLHPRDPGEFRQLWHVANDIGPGFAAVARELDIAVIRTNPDGLPIARGFADRIDGRVHLGVRVVDRDASRFFLLLLLRIIRG